LGESLSFLHQNDMKIVIVIGDRNGSTLDLEILKVINKQITVFYVLFKRLYKILFFFKKNKSKSEDLMIRLIHSFYLKNLPSLPIFNGTKLFTCRKISETK